MATWVKGTNQACTRDAFLGGKRRKMVSMAIFSGVGRRKKGGKDSAIFRKRKGEKNFGKRGPTFFFYVFPEKKKKKGGALKSSVSRKGRKWV